MRLYHIAVIGLFVPAPPSLRFRHRYIYYYYMLCIICIDYYYTIDKVYIIQIRYRSYPLSVFEGHSRTSWHGNFDRFCVGVGTTSPRDAAVYNV